MQNIGWSRFSLVLEDTNIAVQGRISCRISWCLVYTLGPNIMMEITGKGRACIPGGLKMA